MNLLLVEAAEIAADRTVRLSDRRAAHLVNVLRVVPEQHLRIGVIDGPFGRAVVRSVNDGEVSLSCDFEDRAPERPRVDLLLALPRPKVLNRLWAQFSAIGVGRILLTNAERVERNYFDTHLLEPGGFRPRLLEGLEQARDTRVPLVTVHRQFRALVEDHLHGIAGASRRLVADPAVTRTVSAALTKSAGERVLLAVGPEGGWNRFELELLAAHGFSAVGLGPRTLRSDTACIALLTLVHEALRPTPEALPSS